MNKQFRDLDFKRYCKLRKNPKATILWVDDERNPNDCCYEQYDSDNPNMTWIEYLIGCKNPGWNIVWVKNFDQFVEFLKTMIPDVVCFDYDLGGQFTGKDCYNYLIERLIEKDELGPMVRCQSSNPSGKMNILGLYENWVINYIKNH